VTFAELVETLSVVDVSGCRRAWQEEWAELVDALKRAAERESKAGFS